MRVKRPPVRETVHPEWRAGHDSAEGCRRSGGDWAVGPRV